MKEEMIPGDIYPLSLRDAYCSSPCSFGRQTEFDDFDINIPVIRFISCLPLDLSAKTMVYGQSIQCFAVASFFEMFVWCRDICTDTDSLIQFLEETDISTTEIQ